MAIKKTNFSKLIKLLFIMSEPNENIIPNQDYNYIQNFQNIPKITQTDYQKLNTTYDPNITNEIYQNLAMFGLDTSSIPNSGNFGYEDVNMNVFF